MAVAVPLYTSDFQNTSYHRVYPLRKWMLTNDAGDLQVEDVPRYSPWRYAEWACTAAPTDSHIDQDLLAAAIDIEELRLSGNGRIPARKWSGIKAISGRFFGEEWRNVFASSGIDQADSDEGWRRVVTTVDAEVRKRHQCQSVIVKLDSLSSTMDNIHQAYFPTPLTHFRGVDHHPVQPQEGTKTNAIIHYQENLVVGLRNDFAPRDLHSQAIRDHLRTNRAHLLVDRTSVFDWLSMMGPLGDQSTILREVPPLVGDAINDLFLTQAEQDRLYQEFFEDTANRILTLLMRSAITPEHIKTHIVAHGDVSAFDLLLEVRAMLKSAQRIDAAFLQRVIMEFYRSNSPVVDAFFCTIMPMPMRDDDDDTDVPGPLNLLLQLVLHSETTEDARTVFDSFVERDIHMSACNVGMVRARLTFMRMTRMASHGSRSKIAQKTSTTMRLLSALQSIVGNSSTMQQQQQRYEEVDGKQNPAFASLVEDVTDTMRHLIREVMDDQQEDQDLCLLMDAVVYPTNANYHFLKDTYTEWLIETDMFTSLAVRYFERVYAPALRGHYLREEFFDSDELMVHNGAEWVNLLTEELIKQIEQEGIVTSNADGFAPSPLEEWRQHTVSSYLEVAEQAINAARRALLADASYTFLYFPLLGVDNLEEDPDNLIIQTAGSAQILTRWLLDQTQPYRVLSECLGPCSANAAVEALSPWSSRLYSQAVVKTFSITSDPLWKWVSKHHGRSHDEAEAVIKIDVDLLYTLAKVGRTGRESRVSEVILNSIDRQRESFSVALMSAIKLGVEDALEKPSRDRALIVMTARSLPRKGQRHSRRYLHEVMGIGSRDDMGQEGTYGAYDEEDDENHHFIHWITNKIRTTEGFTVVDRFTVAHGTDRPATNLISILYGDQNRTAKRNKKKKRKTKRPIEEENTMDMQWASTAPCATPERVAVPVPQQQSVDSSMALHMFLTGAEEDVAMSSEGEGEAEGEGEGDDSDEIVSEEEEIQQREVFTEDDDDLLSMNMSGLSDVIEDIGNMDASIMHV